MRVVRALVDEGEIPRGRVREITGRGPTVCAEVIRLGLAQGYFDSPSPKGPLRIAFPARLLPSSFPGLYLESPEEEGFSGP